MNLTSQLTTDPILHTTGPRMWLTRREKIREMRIVAVMVTHYIGGWNDGSVRARSILVGAIQEARR